MNTYSPGESVRFTNTVTILGVLTDLPSLNCYVHGEDGTTIAASVVHDSTGQYHADVTLPLTARPGKWVYRWVAVGSGPSTSGLKETPFQVQQLAF